VSLEHVFHVADGTIILSKRRWQVTCLHEQQCEFCSEFIPPYRSRFHSQFGSDLQHRVVLREGGFVAMPSMGQIVPDSLMLLPVSHVERFSDLNPDELSLAERLLRRLSDVVQGRTAIFEHGARSCTGGSCGIYHAHIHIIPLSPGMNLEQMAADLSPTSKTFQDIMQTASQHDQYLFLWDGDHRLWFRPVPPSDATKFPSQYFRRLIASAVGDPDAWDWRLANQPESAVVSAYSAWTRLLHSSLQQHSWGA
jgi:diadenosine tetraphosphate (Ap4A) HIT family hydrolase